MNRWIPTAVVAAAGVAVAGLVGCSELDVATPAGPWFTWLLALGLAEEAWPWLVAAAVAPLVALAWRRHRKHHRKGDRQ